MNKDAKIFVAGHRGMVGGAIHRKLLKDGYRNIVTRSRAELDLTRQGSVEEFFDRERPEFVFLAAAKVGGIFANDHYKADFIFENLAIETNVIHAAFRYRAAKLLFLGSSCVYPRDCPQPIQEASLLTGPLESTNRPYAVAKIAGIELCRAHNLQYGTRFICAMPTNLYGTGDNYDLETSHVLPALLRKFHEALPDREVTVWGSGTPQREFLFVDDLAEACCFLMDRYEGNEIINVGTGSDLSIRELCRKIQAVTGHRGPIRWDPDQPDGTPRKVLDVSKIRALGWEAKVELDAGLKMTYEQFKAEARGGEGKPRNEPHGNPNA